MTEIPPRGIVLGMINVGKLVPLEKNPREISKASLERLAESIKRDPEFMRLRPIVVDESWIVIGGNQRLAAIKTMGMNEIPDEWVRMASGISDEQRERFILIDNSPEGMSGKWDHEILKADFSDAALDLTGMKISIGKIDGEEKNETPLADIQMKGVGEWDMPELIPGMSLGEDDRPKITITHMTQNESQSGIFLWNYNSFPRKLVDWKRCIVGFYVDDDKFESIWNDVNGKIEFFAEKGVRGIISPNFSAYYGYPAPLRIWNIFRSRVITRMAQDAGIRVAVDISGTVADMRWALDGIPKGNVISFQVHRESKEHSSKKNAVIQEAISRIDPSEIWVYGQEEKASWYPALSGKPVHWIAPFTVLMRNFLNRKEK